MQPTYSTSLLILLRDFWGSLSEGNKLRVMYEHSITVYGYIGFHIKTENKKATLRCTMAMLSPDYLPLLKEYETCTHKAAITCYTGAEVIRGKFIEKLFTGERFFFCQLSSNRNRALIHIGWPLL